MAKDQIWKNQPDRPNRPGESPIPDRAAQFGYEQIPREEKADRVLKHFDAVAGKYDFMNSLLSLWIHHIWKRKAVGMLGLLPGERVLDVCGGTGDLSILASGFVGPSGRIVLYDFNAKMMATGRSKARGEDGSISYVQGDAQCIAFPDGCFDAAIIGFGIRNLTRMEFGFMEMHRVLRSGGRMLCLEFSKPVFGPFRWLYDIYSFHIMPFLGAFIAGNRQAYLHLAESIRTFPLPDALSDMLADIGFADVTYRRFTNGIAVAHLAKKRP